MVGSCKKDMPNATVKYCPNPQPNEYCPSIECDFVYLYQEHNSNGDTIYTPYHCTDGSDIEVADDHYNNSSDLQQFVSEGLFEVINL